MTGAVDGYYPFSGNQRRTCLGCHKPFDIRSMRYMPGAGYWCKPCHRVLLDKLCGEKVRA